MHNAARAAPASLAAPESRAAPSSANDATTALHVRVHATPAYAAQTPDWKAHVASLVAQASTTLDASVGARLVIDASEPWEHPAGARLDADLAALREEDAGDGADLVIGLVGGLPLTTQDFDQAGMSELPGKHLVVRAPNIAGEYAAIEKAFDELSAEARTRLRRERIRHREVAVLLHEVGHALGAPHQSLSGSLMRPAYDAKMSEFDPDSIARMKGRLAHAAEPPRDATASPAPQARSDEPHGAGQAAQAKKAEHDEASSDAPSELRVEDRDRWQRASALASGGDASGAWSAARPLFAAYPHLYAVQDLRCKLAMTALGSYDAARKECDALMTLTMKAEAGAK